jgi:hypothetical protein
LKLTEKDKKNAAKSICLCGFPTRTSGTSETHPLTLAQGSQGLFLKKETGPGTCNARAIFRSGQLGVYIRRSSRYNGVVKQISLSERSNPLGKPNFSFQKHQKEMAKKRKNEEKKQRKLEKNTNQPSEEPAQPSESGEVK